MLQIYFLFQSIHVLISTIGESSCNILFSPLSLVFHVLPILSEVLCWVVSFAYSSFKRDNSIQAQDCKYSLMNELDGVRLKQKTTLFLLTVPVTLYNVKPLFYSPDSALGFIAFSVTFNNNKQSHFPGTKISVQSDITASILLPVLDFTLATPSPCPSLRPTWSWMPPVEKLGMAG